MFQNLDYIRERRPTHVLVLAGDHVYKMDYGPMIAYHMEKGADVTVGVVEVSLDEARDFGVMTVDADKRVIRFDEKPSNPQPMPGRDDIALASMGIYIFRPKLLERLLEEDAFNPESAHDFGRNIIPACIHSRAVFAYPFQDVRTRAQSYWRDVGNVDAFYDANLELVYVSPELNLYDEIWPIWTYQVQQPPAKFVLDDGERRGIAVNSMVSGGCIISGAEVRESLLFSRVHVEERSVVERSVVLPNVHIGPDCRIRRAVIDEDSDVPEGTVIGYDPEADARRFYVTKRGVVLVTSEMLRKGGT